MTINDALREAFKFGLVIRFEPDAMEINTTNGFYVECKPDSDFEARLVELIGRATKRDDASKPKK